MPQIQDRSLNLLTCSPVRYYSATTISEIANEEIWKNPDMDTAVGTERAHNRNQIPFVSSLWGQTLYDVPQYLSGLDNLGFFL